MDKGEEGCPGPTRDEIVLLSLKLVSGVTRVGDTRGGN